MNQSLMLFAIGIMKFDVINWEDKKPKLLELIDFDNECIDGNECYTDYFKYGTRPPYFDSFVDIMKDDFDNIANEYTEGLSDRYRGECPFKSLESWQLWSQRYNNQQYHSCHNHGVGNLSCVLYLEFDKSVHSPTWFHSPFNDPFTGYNQEYVPQVDEGDIILFPAMLLHEAPNNTSNVKRTIMSFNIPIG